MNCETCKRSLMQGGKCCEKKSNCLFYENEPRGKMVRSSFRFEMSSNATYPIIKYNSKVVFEDNGNAFEVTIKKINWINMETMICSVDCEYHENEKPYCEKKKMFKIVT